MSNIKVSNPNNIKIYTVSGQSNSRSIPDWLARRNRKKLRNDTEWANRVELIQDFEFPEASMRVRTTKDGRHAMATGVYKPQIRVYEFSEMSLKFERHTDAENVTFQILSDDWTKSVHLQADRTIEFHSQSAMHYKTRIPKFGRDLGYHYPSCDLLIAGASSEIYRLNLEQGRFLNSLQTSVSEEAGINVIDVNPAHQLFGFGSGDGILEFWDPRCRARVSMLAPVLPSKYGLTPEDSFEISQLKFKDDGLGMAVGLSTGHVLLYDMRNPTPYLIKDHQYGLPIKNLQWIPDIQGDTSKTKIASVDSKVIKLWNAQDGNHYTSIEPMNDINDFWNVPGTGLIFCANEGIQMQSYYIPSLGPAPSWCSFLDNLTEEMEEKPQQTVYDDYKFITRKELSSLGLDNLIGSNVLRAYMHGFLMDLRLYEQARLVANPFAYEEYRERKIATKLEETRGSRIRATSNLPKVNAGLAQKLIDESATRKSKGKLLQDSRFTDLFNNPDFQVDEEAPEFRMLNPLSVKAPAAPREASPKPADEESEPEGKGSDEDSSDDDDLLGWKGNHRPGGRSAAYHAKRGSSQDSKKTGFSRGGSRGSSRGSSRGASRGSSRGGSRGASRGSSRGSSRGGSCGGQRGNSRGGSRGRF
ncbi:Small ribosomal subunit biogenesis [Entomophthora muscae]|uniref:Small ribosomal subunit biogenesis n=1 Tax=Entomophthora muscae TaxID=34485 RepID=A0ACC2RMR0_9FUNG|nr:Small ribosomal subunit biogenesis [Entomophthora muscae]